LAQFVSAIDNEVKCDLLKAERDRLIGQTAGYSREWVTWIVLVDTPPSRVGAVEKLLADKGLGHILVFAFSKLIANDGLSIESKKVTA
jgi:hypothetical protein